MFKATITEHRKKNLEGRICTRKDLRTRTVF